MYTAAATECRVAAALEWRRAARHQYQYQHHNHKHKHNHNHYCSGGSSSGPRTSSLERCPPARFNFGSQRRALAASCGGQSATAVAAVAVRAQASPQSARTALADVVTNDAVESVGAPPTRARETVILLPGFFNDAKMYDGYGLGQRTRQGSCCNCGVGHSY